MHNDIPEARRQPVPSPKRQVPVWSSPLVLVGVGGGVLLLLVFGIFILRPATETADQSASSGENARTINPSDLLGHHPYNEADVANLVPVDVNPDIELHEVAARSFNAMVQDAQADGIDLVALSGFRSKEDQEFLFFKVKEERNQATSKRAEVSAPPGYSEHHTGYAVDIGDRNAPETHTESSFANTEAFAWLQTNAARYSFELSFPKDNAQGVSYEPWHWRFVGDQKSLETFYKGR